MKRRLLDVLTGVFVGAVLFGGSALAASGVTAVPSSQPIYVDGRQVQMEAYNINGNNYVKLRDIAALVDFGVNWNSATRSVEIDTDSPYEPEQTSGQSGISTLPTGNENKDLESIREEIVVLTNELRQENGLPILTMEEDLMAAAQVRAEEAAATITYRHTRPDGSDNDTVLLHTGTLILGENLGMKDLRDDEVSDLAEIQVTSWSNSAGHYQNMLDIRYHSMGAGIAQDKYGMYYVVQLFAGGDYTVVGIDGPIIP